MQSNVDPEAGSRALASAEVCCTSMSDAPYIPFENVSNQIVLIDSSRPVVALPTGKTFVLAIALPPARTWKRLTIDSHYTGMYIPSSKIFYPTIAILNADRIVTRTILDSVFTFANATWGEPSRLTATIELSSDPLLERYIVIYTTTEAATSTRNYSAQTTTGFMIGTVPIIIPTQTNRATSGSVTGGVKVKAESSEQKP